ncbi:MAG: hypothetical protein EU550_04020 [Promethearchaeota archaeon]|nr:MAG: hypothetical protein EU550_04020 [Candidatus Lokiarchaeota archaeon]
MPTKEEITELAFQRYKSGESRELSIWYLAYYTEKLKANINSHNLIEPLESESLVGLINEEIEDELIEPDEKKVRELAEKIYSEDPEKSKLHWFIAEKILLLEEIEEIINNHHKK